MGKEKDIARALQKGGVFAPLFGTTCILSTDKETIVRLLGSAYQLVHPEKLPSSDLKSSGLLNLPVVLITEKGGPGWTIAPAGLPEAVVGLVDQKVWFGIPDQEENLEELLEMAGNWIKMRLSKDMAIGIGPTVLDITSSPPVVLRKGAAGVFQLERILGAPVLLSPGVILSVLVVCTGNSCRSPLAAAFLSQTCTGMPVVVSSAGIAAPVGNPPTQFAIAVGKEMGVDITSHRARQLDKKMVEIADLILVMEQTQRQFILEQVPEAADKVRLLAGYPEKEQEIADPIGRSIEFYRQVALQLKSGALRVAADLKNRWKTEPHPDN
ncbi:low molecular weight protein arginine phosphatase [candidate division WOR-3 bacterium]|nr:low molecular weight protein arginine phosphatase [candidate division WOR-3 bacterium]